MEGTAPTAWFRVRSIDQFERRLVAARPECWEADDRNHGSRGLWPRALLRFEKNRDEPGPFGGWSLTYFDRSGRPIATARRRYRFRATPRRLMKWSEAAILIEDPELLALVPQDEARSHP